MYVIPASVILLCTHATMGASAKYYSCYFVYALILLYEAMHSETTIIIFIMREERERERERVSMNV